MKTYQVAECASGCPFHSTVDAFRHESDGRYAAGKAAVVAWMTSRAQ